MQTCPNCQARNQDGAKFCASCGKPLSDLLPSGTMLQARYRIQRLLGKGGMGAVYQAEDLRLGNHTVAVKENFDVTPEAQQQFHIEANVLASLSHPSLPRVSDHFIEPSGKQYLVMDFVEGQDLAEMLDKSGTLSVSQVRPWFQQVCEAVQYMHAQPSPVIHRDIKPGNIKITPSGQAMLVDFGIAKLLSAGQKTAAAARAVTPGFSPPEQYGGGQHTDARSDVYALAATLYCLLTGQAPPDAMDRFSGTMMKPVRQVNPSVLPAMDAAITRGLVLKPEDRTQSVGELLRGVNGQTQPPAYSVAPTMAAADVQSIPAAIPMPPPARPAPISNPVSRPKSVSVVVPAVPASVPTFALASVQRRFWAGLIDSILASVMMTAALYFPTEWLRSIIDPGAAAIVGLAAMLLVYWWYYIVLPVSGRGQTPGKRLLHVRIIRKDGLQITRGTMLMRWLGQVISACCFGLGHLWVLWDTNRQAWHDKMAGTYVIMD